MHNKYKDLKLVSARDDLFQTDRYPKPFAFTREVAEVFDDMVSRSIPLYADVTRYSCQWTQRFYQPGSRVYDLGCSTGTTLHCLAGQLSPGAHLVGVDNSPSMLAKAEEKLASERVRHHIQLECSDLLAIQLAPASVVIMNYTLQFVPVAQRQPLLAKIYAALAPGGLFFLSEKLRANDPAVQETMTHIYESFKRVQGYSASEIARKKEALEQVLVPQTEDELKVMLADVGFKTRDTVIRWNNFASLVAIKA